MKSVPRRLLLVAFGVGVVVGAASSVTVRWAYRQIAAEPRQPPVPRPHVRLRHEALSLRPKPPDVKVVFLGDSITEFWEDQPLWDRLEAEGALNLGLMGDTAEGLLWRVRHGALDGLSPRAVVVMIGTNDLELAGSAGRDAAEKRVVESARALVAELRATAPGAAVVLMGVLPRGGVAGDVDELNRSAARVNASLASLADGTSVRFLDLTARFLEGRGRVPDHLMPDGVHLSPDGYDIWHQAIAPVLSDVTAAPHSAARSRPATTPATNVSR